MIQCTVLRIGTLTRGPLCRESSPAQVKDPYTGSILMHAGSSCKTRAFSLYKNGSGFRHTCDISLFRRDLPIFEQISLSGISKFPYITYTSPYFKFLISLFEIKNFLLCLIILPILKSKSPYLASQMYHMYGFRYQIFSQLAEKIPN